MLVKAAAAAWSTFERLARAFFDRAIAQDLCLALGMAGAAWHQRGGVR
jgi:hypothetical protein